jgi:hypothetical protein
MAGGKSPMNEFGRGSMMVLCVIALAFLVIASVPGAVSGTDLKAYLKYEDGNDGVHPLKTELYYEWWYCDFRFDNGWSAAVVYYYSDMTKKPRAPTVEMSIYDPGGKRYFEKTDVKTDEAAASEEKCDVRIGGHRFWQEGNTYRLIVESSKVGADLTLQRETPAMFIPAEVNNPDSAASDKHFWCVSIPRGKASGKLVVEGKEISVQGVCYHDHNWGTGQPNLTCGGWVWGHFFDDTYSGFYALVYPVSSQPFTGFIYLAKHEELILLSDAVQVMTVEERFDEPTGLTIPIRFVVTGKEGSCEFSGAMDVQNVVEKDHQQFPDFKTHNWRFIGNYEGAITLDGATDNVKGQGFHERYLLRLK